MDITSFLRPPPPNTWTFSEFERINRYSKDREHMTAPVFKRLTAAATPLFAALDLLHHTRKTVWHIFSFKPKDVAFDLINCSNSLFLFIASIPLTPFALISPEATYSTQKQVKLSRLSEELRQWVADPTVTGKKEEAARRIEEAFRDEEESLYLDDLELSQLPKCISRLTQLTALNLDNNHFTSLPQEIGPLKNQLTHLNMNNNGLTSLSSEIGQFKNLLWLHLNHNDLTSLPQEIGQLNKLTFLLVRHNRLKSLPQEIGQLKKLVNLGLRGNQLISLPTEIGQLSNLDGLYLSHNKLASLPDNIGNLSQLTELHVNDNPSLNSLPLSLGRCSGLTYLDIDGTPISAGQRDEILTQCRAQKRVVS